MDALSEQTGFTYIARRVSYGYLTVHVDFDAA